jgi:GTPase SAR1 family protein
MTSWDRDKLTYNNNPLLPQKPLRCLIIGSSGSGKTSLLIRMLTNDYFDFDRIVFASVTIFQPEFQILIEGYKHGLKNKHIRKILDNQKDIPDYKKAIPMIAYEIPDYDKSHIEVVTYEDSSDIPSPKMLQKEGMKTLVIVDDMMTEDQKPISRMFTHGRPFNISVIYLSQSYFELHRRTIRLQANFLILFELNELDIQNIYKDLCSRDFAGFHEFDLIMRDVFKEQYSFFSINRDERDVSKKYLKKFESPLISIMTRISSD